MGLSAMQDMPGIDQHMRFANIAGQMQYVAPNAWLGENSLDGLGLGGGDPAVTPDTINAISGGITNIISAIGALKKNKNKGNPPASAPVMMTHQDAPPDSGGGSGTGKLLLIGGAVILAGVVIYMVYKKKKGAHAGE